MLIHLQFVKAAFTGQQQRCAVGTDAMQSTQPTVFTSGPLQKFTAVLDGEAGLPHVLWANWRSFPPHAVSCLPCEFC